MMFPDYALINRKISAIPYLMRYLGRQEYRDLNSICIDNVGNIKISYLCYQRPPLVRLLMSPEFRTCNEYLIKYNNPAMP